MEVRREDERIRQEFERRRKEDLPKLREQLKEAEAGSDQERSLIQEIERIATRQDEIEYDMKYAALWQEHTRECRTVHLATIEQWVEERKVHSLNIHTRQLRANHIFDLTLHVEFVGKHVQHLKCGLLEMHANTTLPQLSLIVHDFAWADNQREPERYFPIMYDAYIIDPDLLVYQQENVVATLDADICQEKETAEQPLTTFFGKQPKQPQPPKKKRRAKLSYSKNPKLIPLKTSLGEVLYYHCGQLPNWADRCHRVKVYLVPHRGSIWKAVEGKAGLTKIQDYVETLDKTHRDFNKRLHQKFLIMLGKASPATLPPLPELPQPKKDMLSKCCASTMILDMKTSEEICRACGKSYDSDTLTRNMLGHDHWIQCSHTTYKRINHFNEWMTQFQAKERTKVSQDVVDKVQKQFNMRRMKKREVTPKTVKMTLKNLGKPYTHFYEHATQIAYRITGIPPPQLTASQEKKLCIFFRETQLPFEEMPKQIKMSREKNYPSYPHVFRKMCELLEYFEVVPGFPKLKSAQKIFEHDAMWKYMCKVNGWRFIPTSIDYDYDTSVPQKTLKHWFPSRPNERAPQFSTAAQPRHGSPHQGSPWEPPACP